MLVNKNLGIRLFNPKFSHPKSYWLLIFCNDFITKALEKMKKFFAPLFALFLLNNVNAQDFCATQMPEEMITWLRDYKADNPGANYYKSTNDIVYLPIKVHIAGTDAGGGYYKLGTLLDAMCTLNRQYEPYDWQFYIYDEINYINSDNLYNHTGNYQSIINSQSVSNVINIFFVANPSGACGYYSSWGGPQNTSGGGRQGFIAINNSCAQDGNTTIAHELGHFFSLPHTFYGWEGRSDTDAPRSTDERVNGSNCNSSGDYFCDTPADFLSDRWNCPYNMTKTDYVGDLYNPDGSLYMSYANDECADHHSNEQIDAIHSYLNDRRGYLLNHTFPNYPIIMDSSETLFPPTGATGVPSNYVNLKWKAIAGASHYHVQGTRSNNINNLSIDTIVTDTSMIIRDLLVGYTYRWRVRAFNKYSTCSPYTIFSTFITTSPTNIVPVIDIQPITCSGAYDGSINVSVNGAQGPYQYEWSNGSSASEVTFLNEGNYIVTVTDGNNESLVLSIDIAEPDPIDLELSLNGTSLIAQTTGGTMPYTYSWSTGASSAGIVVSPGSTYSVTITDKNGCTSTKSFTYTGINQLDASTSLRVYPNPTAGASSFSIELVAPQAIQATVQVLDNAGRVVYATNQQFETGLNVTEVPVADLSSGLYFVRIVGKDVVKTTKLLVY